MAKPRVFVSSTYYDLKHIRANLEAFVSQLGFEPVLFESGDIPFLHDRALDSSCYDVIPGCHLFVLIIGGRYGSTASSSNSIQAKKGNLSPEDQNDLYKFYNSITSEEYRTARNNDIPIYIFVEKGVSSEYLTFKENRGNDKIRYAHVDNVNVFLLLDEIFSQQRNNIVREFEKFDDISFWLKEQWAGLFGDFLAKKKSDSSISDLATQVQSLSQTVAALRSYSEAIVRKVEPDAKKSSALIKSVEDKLAEEVIFSNPLIRYIRRESEKAGMQNIDAKTLSQRIASNENATGFLNSIVMPEATRQHLNKQEVIEHVEADFLNCRKKLWESKSAESLFENAPPVLINIGDSLDATPRAPIRLNKRDVGAPNRPQKASSRKPKHAQEKSNKESDAPTVKANPPKPTTTEKKTSRPERTSASKNK